MLYCDIKGCNAWVSEIMQPEKAAHWFVARPEQIHEAKMLALEAESGLGRKFGYHTERLLGRWLGKKSKVQELEQIWPNLDWWALGGVEKITLCPKHKLEVANEVVKLRIGDPSMNPEAPDRSNRS